MTSSVCVLAQVLAPPPLNKFVHQVHVADPNALTLLLSCFLYKTKILSRQIYYKLIASYITKLK